MEVEILNKSKTQCQFRMGE